MATLQLFDSKKKGRLGSLETNRKMSWPLLLITFFMVVNIGDAGLGNPPIGGSINVFNRYGYLSQNMRVMKTFPFRQLIFEEPTVNVFKNSSQVREAKGQSLLSNGLHLVFCKNAEQMLEFYFRNFRIQDVEKTYNAFNRYWYRIILSNHLGIHESFVTGNYSYIVLSSSRYHDSQTLADSPQNLELDETVASEVDNLIVGDAGSFMRFTNKFGTHYIHSYVTGDMLYQVFVYEPQTYVRIEELIRNQGMTETSKDLLDNYLSPLHAKHIGLILTASGDGVIEIWADNHMEVKKNVTYKSLFTLVRNKDLRRDVIEILQENALLELELRSLAPLFKDPERRKYFEELVNNYIALYEVNL